ncbi:ADP-ribose pyrophosphatase [Planctomycetes bacterium Pla163]|uniref:GDP-mannose pyrophosphatase n=1 Tax=Rohdeia mirabilis TaxID=2528008 RepID=A0A518D1K8_9BACT|nr:ADP-ribose pyrophosphatase [Planctomycetes bacterium Pla163]
MSGGADDSTPSGPGWGDGPEWDRARPHPVQREAGDPEPFEPFERIGSERVYDSPWCGLRRDFIRTAPGEEQDYHVFEVTNAVAVVPFLTSGDLLLLWHHRHPAGRSQWELPAGRIAANEAPADAAARELLEETGHRAGRIVALPGFFPTGGISAHYAHVFAALDCEPVEAPDLEPAERLSVHRVARSEVERRLLAGHYADAFTSLSLFYAFARYPR